MRLLKKGSVKEVYVLQEPQEERLGEGRFVFTDSYSVFDWGEMPQGIPSKGEALCLMGAYFFERLEALGIKTHYLGLVEEGEVKPLSALKAPTRVMAVKLVRVVEPRRTDGGYDYSVFEDLKGNFLIPLEVIYRNALPEGSSVFRRLKEGTLSLEDLGLKEVPKPGQRLKEPILDVSTKLEATDRYLTFAEAQRLAGLRDEEMGRIRETTLLIDRLITEAVEPHGIANEDGKVEFAFDEKRELMVVDVVGTPDECRFTWSGVPLSKEALRILYRRTPWYREVERAKREDPVGWKGLVGDPPRLPQEAVDLVSDLYRALCNAITGKRWFEVDPLEEVAPRLKEIVL